MNLKFLGTGAAFFPLLGSNSTYLEEDDKILIIDVGDGIFKELFKSDILNKGKEIFIITTHTHSDHVGSLGTLLMYTGINNITTNLIFGQNKDHKNRVLETIKCFGVPETNYNIIDESEVISFNSFDNIELFDVHHLSGVIACGIKFTKDNKNTYYTGDTNDIEIVAKIINESNFERLYVDTSNEKTRAHIYLGDLNDTVPNTLKDKVWCMHFNNYECIEEAKKYGFNIAEKE